MSLKWQTFLSLSFEYVRLREYTICYLTGLQLAKRKAEELEDFGAGRCNSKHRPVLGFNHHFL